MNNVEIKYQYSKASAGYGGRLYILADWGMIGISKLKMLKSLLDMNSVWRGADKVIPDQNAYLYKTFVRSWEFPIDGTCPEKWLVMVCKDHNIACSALDPLIDLEDLCILLPSPYL